MRVPRPAFARRYWKRAQVYTIRFRALQQADVDERFVIAQRQQQIAQHRQVGRHLVFVTPSRDQSRFFIKRCVDDMRDTAHGPDGSLTGFYVEKVERNVPPMRGRRQIRRAPRRRDHIPAGSDEGLDCGLPDHPR